MNESMGQIIRRLRKEKNLTQEELAEQLNITSQAVSKWECGDGMPDISQVVPLANVFVVSTDVLFGTDNTDCDEDIENFISEIERKLCNRPEGMSDFEIEKACCEEVSEKLKTYPNNYRLLAYSLGNIVCLLDAYDEAEHKDKTAEKKAWENECIRQANVIINHCTEIKYLNIAHKWMTELYIHTNDLAKAEEHVRKLAVFNPYSDGGKYLAYLHYLNGRTEEEMKQSADNINNALDYLSLELISLGHTYKNHGKLEEAYACYRLYPDIYDIMVGDREDEMPFYDTQSYDCCAIICIQLGRYDEAMDWLEKWLRHERLRAKNHNVITKSKLPYFYGRELHYTAETYNRTDAITPTLAESVFDPIRNTDRFKAIVSSAEAFERGE